MASVAAVEQSTKNQTVSQTVVAAVADLVDAKPGALDPLYYTVDPEALNALFESNAVDSGHALPRVTFTYEGCDVEVAGDGTVTVSRANREVTKQWG